MPNHSAHAPGGASRQAAQRAVTGGGRRPRPSPLLTPSPTCGEGAGGGKDVSGSRGCQRRLIPLACPPSGTVRYYCRRLSMDVEHLARDCDPWIYWASIQRMLCSLAPSNDQEQPICAQEGDILGNAQRHLINACNLSGLNVSTPSTFAVHGTATNSPRRATSASSAVNCSTMCGRPWNTAGVYWNRAIFG